MVKGGMSAGISPAGAGIKGFNERSAAATGVFVERGHDLLGMMLD
jgi:hypothetical protein